MSEPRHYEDAIQLCLRLREGSYDTAPTFAWSTACSMRDFADDAGHETWTDWVQDDDDVTHHTEYPTVQEIVRQSVEIPYSEPRTKPNTLAGLLGLSLGIVVTTQDAGGRIAYRHAITPANPLLLPSISAQVAHQHSSQYLYTGLKADSFTLRSNGPYLQFECPLIGSGTRATATTAFQPAIDEAWLRWGDSHLYLKDVTGVPLAVPATPVQGSTNLGASTVDVSTRVRRMELSHPNQLLAERGYQASTGMVRGSLLTAKRRTDLELELDVDTAREATELAWYLQQKQLAFEWQCVGEIIATGGVFRFGATVIIPRIQLRAIPRDEQDEFDTLTLHGRVMDDKTNPVLLAWVYNAQPGYMLVPSTFGTLVLSATETWEAVPGGLILGNTETWEVVSGSLTLTNTETWEVVPGGLTLANTEGWDAVPGVLSLAYVEEWEDDIPWLLPQGGRRSMVRSPIPVSRQANPVTG